MTDIRIVSDPHASEGLKQVVSDHLDAYNVAITGFPEYSPVNLFLRDAGDEVMGGLLAAVWGGVLFIRILWVSEALRGRGFGRRLMEMAERRAVERGCRHIFVDTFSFQAPGFYEKLGYQIYAKAEDWPLGHAHHFFRKDLPTAS
ncbi:MAG TPA: GNAT family N-acetyltransferase [Methylomirabilota bacterium]|jgi:ribosomal protein S18 acetylase RimI-like enzyme|nr:GNAT family N-acetyltransferase [Methylomirabilota bacterium]